MALSASRRLTVVVCALGLTQIIGYGTLYYSFGVLAPEMALSFGWSQQWVFGALSTSLLVGGLVAPIAGRWADRIGAARLMAGGSLGAALALVACALAPEGITFLLGLVAIELAGAFVLYATAFAALAQMAGAGAQRRITHLTLIAGFASTLFWPITTALHAWLTWREVYLVFAALNLFVAAPIHLWLSRGELATTGTSPADTAAISPIADPTGRILLLMLAGFAALGFVSSGVLVHMLPLLTALELGAAASVVAALFGPAQVLSRLANMQFGGGLSQPALAVLAPGLMAIGLVVLALAAPWPPGAAAFAILFGCGSGLSSIVSGTLPLALFGLTGYGRRLGLISSARLAASSFAPFIVSLLAVLPARLSLWPLAAIALLAAGCFGGIWLGYRAQRVRSAVPAE
jgi:MFS family permease